MKERPTYWTDKKIEVVLGNLLRWGVIISSIIVLTGGIVYLSAYGTSAPHYHTFRGLTKPFHSMTAVAKGISEGDGEAIIQLGVMLLIATPVARIVFSIIAFAREKDRLYILIGCIVLAIIIASVLSDIKG